MPIGRGANRLLHGVGSPGRVGPVSSQAPRLRVHPTRGERRAGASSAIFRSTTSSLTDAEDGRGAAALRELLHLYGDRRTPPSGAGRSRAFGRQRAARVVRRLPLDGPPSFARGVEVTLECDESAFEGTSVVLLGLALDRFFTKYVSINSFTETVLRSVQRGEIVRWPMRIGPPAHDLSWIERLAGEPGSFDFHVALRRLEAMFPDKPRLGEAVRPADESVRIGQVPSMSFEPSAVAQFVPMTDEAPAIAQGELSRPLGAPGALATTPHGVCARPPTARR